MLHIHDAHGRAVHAWRRGAGFPKNRWRLFEAFLRDGLCIQIGPVNGLNHRGSRGNGQGILQFDAPFPAPVPFHEQIRLPVNGEAVFNRCW
jgi:hypothetical protein